MVTVLSLKAGLDELLIPELAPMIDATRQLSGCLIFDLYRLSEEHSTLVLHEVWNSREALEAFALSPLKTEITALASRGLAQPFRSWTIEEVCLT